MHTMHSESASGNQSALDVRAYEEYPLLMPLWGYVASAFVLFLIGFFGFFLNLMVILLMFKDRQLWTPINMILFNLVCADFSVSVLGNPFTFASAIFRRWVFGNRMCIVYGFFMSLLGITSITTLTVLSFERYLLVTRPLGPRHLTPRGAAVTILFIWSYSLALTTPPLMGWGNYVTEGAKISCSVNWQEQTYNTFTYIMFLFATGQTIPCIVISFSYYNIVRTLKKTSARTGRVNRGEAKVTAMVFVMIVAFMVAWTPYSIVALVEQFGQTGMVSPGVAVIPALVAKSSICYDPIIYIGMNTQFRQSIKRMFGIHSKRATGSQMERGIDNTVISATPAICTRTKLDLAAETEFNVPIKLTNKQVIIMDAPTRVIQYEDGNLITSSNMTALNKSLEAERSAELEKDDSSHNSFDGLTENNFANGAGNDNPYEKIDHSRGVYKNEAFEGKGNEMSEGRMQISKIRHSSSMDMSKTRQDMRRKMSIQVFSEDFNNTRMVTNSVVGKVLERRPKDNLDNLKALLFSNEKEEVNL